MQIPSLSYGLNVYGFLRTWYDVGLHSSRRFGAEAFDNVKALNQLQDGNFFNDKGESYSSFKDRPISIMEWEKAVGAYSLLTHYPELFSSEKVIPKDISIRQFLYDIYSRESLFVYCLENGEALVGDKHPAVTMAFIKLFEDYYRKMYRRKMYRENDYRPDKADLVMFIKAAENTMSFLDLNHHQIDEDCYVRFFDCPSEIVNIYWRALGSYCYSHDMSPEDFANESNLFHLANFLLCVGAMKCNSPKTTDVGFSQPPDLQ